MWTLPTNGLDRSLHLPIYIGLLVVTYFAEAFGWTYAGLVVPGYLAAVTLAAPVTTLLITVETVLVYLIVSLIGIWIPKLGAWSTSFGRERFFLFIVVSALMRVVFEGVLVPQLPFAWVQMHSRELYSIGLVLVPLFANVFWNSGILHAGPRLGVVSLITYGGVLLLSRYSNYSVSHLLMANESGASEFLRSSKAQIILLFGAMLGARGNVLYGWDYNGILVPSLLAVAWYAPKKLFATFVEAILVFLLSKWVTSKPPFSRMLIVGTRRMLVVFSIGLLLKFALGYTLLRVAPSIELPDYLGFGYILPSLLAVKMWNKGQIGVVVMPTLQVSLFAFLGGNLLGYGLGTATGKLDAKPEAPLAILRSGSFERSLLLADIAPEPNLSSVSAPREDTLLYVQTLVESLRDSVMVSPDLLSRAKDLGLVIESDPTGTLYLLRGEHRSPDDERIVPRLVVRARWGSEGATPSVWKGLIVAEAPGPSDPLLGAALTAMSRSHAAAMLLASRHPKLAMLDRALESVLRQRFGFGILAVEHGQPSELRIVGSIALPDTLLHVLSKEGIQAKWTANVKTGAPLRERTILTLDDATCLHLATDLRNDGAPLTPPLQWDGTFTGVLAAHAKELTQGAPSTGHEPPPAEERRMYSTLVRQLADKQGIVNPNAWENLLAASLGLRWVRVVDRGQPIAIGLVDGGTSRVRRHAAFFVRFAGSQDLLIEVPAPLWEVGTYGASLSLGIAADARAFLFAGQSPSEDPKGQTDARTAAGAISFYQRAHEVWLEKDRKALSLQGVAGESPLPVDVLVSFGRELPEGSPEPSWFQTIRSGLERSALSVGRYDGQRASAQLGGSGDPTMAFASRFADGRFGILWLAATLRTQFSLVESERPVVRSLEKLSGSIEGPIDTMFRELWTCQQDPTCKTRRTAPPSCTVEIYREQWTRYLRSRNPYDLSNWSKGTLLPNAVCPVHWMRDHETGAFWITAVGSDGLLASPFDLGSDRRSDLSSLPEATDHVSFPLRLGVSMVSLQKGPRNRDAAP